MTNESSAALQQKKPEQYWPDSFESAKDRLVLIPRSPASFLVYWEWTAAKTALFKKGTLAPEVVIKIVYAGSKLPANEFKSRWDELRTYAQPPARGVYLYAVLQVYNSTGGLQTVLESNTILIPRGAPIDDTLPSSDDAMRKSQ